MWNCGKAVSVIVLYYCVFMFLFLFLSFSIIIQILLYTLQLEVQPINLNQECINLIQILNHVFGELDFFIIPSRISFLSGISIN
jgi:flagellar biosynthesis protein FlhB